MNQPATLPHQIKSKFTVGDSGQCWIWNAAKINGYGVIGTKSGTRRAHRIIYELLIGPIPNGFFLCHHCDTPECVNPGHMFVGTPMDNISDMIKKGRKVSPKVPRIQNRGANNGNTHFTKADVDEIRNLRSAGIKLKEIAEKFSCSISTVHRVFNRQTHWNDDETLRKSLKNGQSG